MIVSRETLSLNRFNSSINAIINIWAFRFDVIRQYVKSVAHLTYPEFQCILKETGNETIIGVHFNTIPA